MHSRPLTRPMPVMIPALGTASSYISVAASGLSSRNGLPGSSNWSTRSRASNLPRSRCFLRADSEPPCLAVSSRARRSATAAVMSLATEPSGWLVVVNATLMLVNSPLMLAIVNRVVYSFPMAASRREQILSTAAELFAARGFHGVSVDELGAACGISGPALYRHFAAKDAMLAEMLVSISEEPV